MTAGIVFEYRVVSATKRTPNFWGAGIEHPEGGLGIARGRGAFHGFAGKALCHEAAEAGQVNEVANSRP